MKKSVLKVLNLVTLSLTLGLILPLAGCGNTTTPSDGGSTPSESGTTPTDGGTTKDETRDSDGNIIISKLSGKNKFLAAKENTVDNKNYQYDYELSASLAFAGATAKVASISGTTSYNENASDHQYVQKNVTKAGMLFASTSYTFNNGNSLIKVNENSNKLSIENTTNIESADYKNVSFNKLINNIKDEVLEDGSESNGKYQIKLKKDVEINSFINISGTIDVDYLVKLLNESQDVVNLSVDAYVTYQDNFINQFVFNGTAIVKDSFTINIEYTQTYTKVGSDVSIDVPSFNGYSINKDDINNDLNILKSAITTFMDSKNSSYNYNTKTTVDHGISKTNPFGCAVNSTSKGDARRVIDSDKVYYNNDLEFDSDYKNNDQYTSDYVKDYHVYRAKLNDGNDTARDEIVRNLRNEYADAIDPSDNDNYYFLYDNYLSSNYVTAISKDVNEEKGTTTYTLGINDDGSKLLLDDYNESIRINGSHDTNSNLGHIDVYQIQDSFSTKASEVKITLDSDNKLTDISSYIKGYYNAVESSVKAPGANQFVRFELESELDDFNSNASYVIPTKDSQIR